MKLLLTLILTLTVASTMALTRTTLPGLTFHVSYSSHSSYSELESFISNVKPGDVHLNDVSQKCDPEFLALIAKYERVRKVPLPKKLKAAPAWSVFVATSAPNRSSTTGSAPIALTLQKHEKQQSYAHGKNIQRPGDHARVPWLKRQKGQEVVYINYTSRNHLPNWV